MNAVVALPATIPDPSTARLPASYEAAQQAIAQCERIDECRDWADRAAAIASYARQAKDDSLRVMAVRIQARAERRLGELLKQIPSGTGAHLKREDTLPLCPDGKRQEEIPPPLTRTEAANSAGLTEHERKTALRVASVPAEDFERQVESASPPSISNLAAQGTAALRAGGVRPPVTREGIEARQALLRFTLFCEEHEPAAIAQAIPPDDLEGTRQCVATIDRWLDSFVASLHG